MFLNQCDMVLLELNLWIQFCSGKSIEKMYYVEAVFVSTLFS